jgi:hypothetical protein
MQFTPHGSTRPLRDLHAVDQFLDKRPRTPSPKPARAGNLTREGRQMEKLQSQRRRDRTS